MSGTKFNCYHGISMMGPNPPPCLECEIQWHTETLAWLTKATARNSAKLESLLAERETFNRGKPTPTTREEQESAA